MELNGEKVPLRISTNSLTVSTDPKASLAKLMASIDPENKHKGDISKYLNVPVLLTIAHAKVTKDGQERTYANITNTSQVPDGIPVPELFDKPVLFDFDNPTE